MTTSMARIGDWVVAVVSIAVMTLTLLWPALVTGTPWAFADTQSYYRGGAAAWAFAADALGIAEAPDAQTDPGSAPNAVSGSAADSEDAAASSTGSAATTGGTSVDAQPTPDAVKKNTSYGIRSVPYSLTVYALVRVAGVWGPIVAMSLAMAALIWLVARDLMPPARLALGLGLAATTALPFYGSLFQPDLLTAAVVLIPIAVMLHADRLGFWALVGLFAAMAFATLAHYGNLPLAALSLVWLGVWGLLRGRRLVVGLVAAPLVAVAAVNLAIGLVVDGGPSLAPGRYPLILARSIEDGPGPAYLEQACPAADWALCEVYDEVPDNIGALLWGKNRIEVRASPEQLARIGAEEVPLLLAILRYDPAGQIGAFARNSVRQFFLFGTSGGRPARYEVTPRTMTTVWLDGVPYPAVPAHARLAAILLGSAAIVWAIARRRHPEALATAVFLLASLVVYAVVCGGLSAPVARYQARLVWIVPLLGAALAFGRRPGDGGTAARMGGRTVA